jgi:hypothetical protein
MEPFTKVHYYAFLLEALSRFPNEGRRSYPPMKVLVRDVLGIGSPRKYKKRFLKATVHQIIKQRLVASDSSSILAEFGVHKGSSITWLSQMFPTRTIYGFDSFSGFPDDGREDWNQDFSVPCLPDVPKNVRLIPGYFEDTLPAFETKFPKDARVGFVHIDCDIYSSTRTVFNVLGNRFADGSVIQFDELLNYSRFVENEFLAFYEFLITNDFDFEWFVKRGRVVDLEEFVTETDELSFRMYRQRGLYQFAAVRLRKGAGFLSRLNDFEKKASRLAALRSAGQILSPTYSS